MHTRTTPLPPVQTTDPVWTLEHLSLVLRLSERATRTVVATAGFPAGFRLGDAPTARRYWLREQVLEHFASLCTTPDPRPAARVSATRAQGRPADPDADALAEIARLRDGTAGAR